MFCCANVIISVATLTRIKLLAVSAAFNFPFASSSVAFAVARSSANSFSSISMRLLSSSIIVAFLFLSEFSKCFCALVNCYFSAAMRFCSTFLRFVIGKPLKVIFSSICSILQKFRINWTLDVVNRFTHFSYTISVVANEI